MDPDLEFNALETDQIDIVDWPLSKTWIDEFSAHPGLVTTRDYSALEIFSFDLNNQRWPTGCDLHKELDPQTDTYKTYFNDTCDKCLRAWMFRLALAYLADKDWIKNEVLKGYGNVADTWVPAPALLGYLDMENLTASSFDTPDFGAGSVHIPSLIFGYGMSRGEMDAKAVELLDAAGFIDTDGNGTRNDPRTGGDLSPLIFYNIRLDDPYRRAATEMMVIRMRAVGIPVNVKWRYSGPFEPWFYKYDDYNLVVGYYPLDPDIDYLEQLFHSARYWSSDIMWGGYSRYVGFCNRKYDYYAEMISQATTLGEVLNSVHNATYLLNKYVSSIPLWSPMAVKAYRPGWQGVVNARTEGVDNRWSFLEMHQSGRDTIKWGFVKNLEGPSVVASERIQDWKILNLIYDSLLSRNPYNPAEEVGLMAKEWSTGEWGAPVKTWCNFTLRENIFWHNGSQCTPEDVKFALEFTRDCGRFVAYNWVKTIELDHVDTWDNRATGGGWGVMVYFNVKSRWALHWAGFLPIFSKDIWLAANAKYGWGYVWPHAPGPFWDWNRLEVRSYRPWEHDANDNGIIDLKEDGTGPYGWYGSDPLLMEWVELEANRNYYLTQDEVSEFLIETFHCIGDVNRDRVINMTDLDLTTHALFTHDCAYFGCSPPHWPVGTEWWEYNPDADFNKDHKVDAYDLYIISLRFSMVAG